MKKSLTAIIVIVLVLAGFTAWKFDLFGAKGPGGVATGMSDIPKSASPYVVAPALDLTRTYTNDTYHFTVKYPAAASTSAMANPATDEDGNSVGDIVIIADQSGMGAQVLISPFDEELTALTVDRIKQDLPDLIALETQDILLGPDGANGKGVAFLDGTTTEASRQIWFIHDRHLYQITAPASYDATLRAMMNTWGFFS